MTFPRDPEIEALRVRIAILEDVLHQIAAPPRLDGTYNLSREACEELAKKALDETYGL